MPQKYLASRINKLPKWARDYIHNVHTFVGAPEIEELTYLRDQNRQLIKLVGELKAENRRLRKKLNQPINTLTRFAAERDDLSSASASRLFRHESATVARASSPVWDSEIRQARF